MGVSFDQTSIEFDNHWQRQLFAGRIVQPPGRLNKLGDISIIISEQSTYIP